MLLDQLPEGIAVAYGAPDFPIIASSRRFDELTGCQASDTAPTKRIEFGQWFLNHRERPDGDQLPIYRAARFGETIRNEELVVVRPDGTRVDVLVDANPIRTSAGDIVGAITCWREVTDIKQAQHALEMAEAQLRDADLRKDEFLGILAHELRGPLSPISNAVHVLKLLGPSDPKLRQIADTIDRQVKAIARLLDDLLDLTRVTRGQLSLNIEPVDIASIVEEAVEWNRAEIELKVQQLEVRHALEPITIHGDSVRLVQVVSNLLGNAVKFTDRGGRIWIIVEKLDEQVIVRVRDTGPGLERSELNNIFDLFYQLQRTADRAGRGLGIGLSLVRRLVEMHGGHVEVFSKGRRCGSEFVFRLPLLCANDVTPSPVRSESGA